MSQEALRSLHRLAVTRPAGFVIYASRRW